MQSSWAKQLRPLFWLLESDDGHRKKTDDDEKSWWWCLLRWRCLSLCRHSTEAGTMTLLRDPPEFHSTGGFSQSCTSNKKIRLWWKSSYVAESMMNDEANDWGWWVVVWSARGGARMVRNEKNSSRSTRHHRAKFRTFSCTCCFSVQKAFLFDPFDYK